MYVYVDESGDLGFSQRSTRFFVVAYLCVEQPFELTKKMKRLLKKLHKKKMYARGYNELKFSNSKDTIRVKVLETIYKSEVDIGYIVLEKAKVKPELQNKRTTLYNFVVVDRIMKNIIPLINPMTELNIIIDKSLPRSSRLAFNNYAKNKASWLFKIRWGQINSIMLSNIKVQHVNSQKEPCLQATDFLAGACFHKYEYGNDFYYRIISGKVKYFDYLWNRRNANPTLPLPSRVHGHHSLGWDLLARYS